LIAQVIVNPTTYDHDHCTGTQNGSSPSCTGTQNGSSPSCTGTQNGISSSFNGTQNGSTDMALTLDDSNFSGDRH
jgi:hypothetical protein